MNLNIVVSPIRVINNCKSGSSARMVTTDGACDDDIVPMNWENYNKSAPFDTRFAIELMQWIMFK